MAGFELRLDRDPTGRVIAEHVDGRTLTTAHDAAGRVVSRATPAGIDSVWDHDACGRPAALTSAGHTLRFTHDAAGRHTSWIDDLGATITNTWDQLGNLTSITASSAFGPGPALVDRRYRHRSDGALTQLHDLTAGDVRRLDLDVAGRIAQVHATDWTASYRYTPAGPLAEIDLQHPEQVERVQHTHAGTLITRAGQHSYTHDADGRTLSAQAGTAAPTRFGYDALDRMTDAWTTDGQHWTYRYDPLGRRIAKTGHDGSGSLISATVFTWSGNHLVEATSIAGGSSSTLTWEYQPDTWTPIIQIDTHTAGGAATRQDFHVVVTDPVGTPTHLLTADGEHITWAAPPATVWGQPLPGRTPPDGKGPTCPLRFPGQYADPETGLNYNHHRYYNPATSRYTTTDPLGLAPAPDPHAYVANPTREIDPLGLAPCRHETLVRQGVSWESTGRLSRKALEAEAAGKGHGISVTTPQSNLRLSTNPSDSVSASTDSLEAAGLHVTETPGRRDPDHHTLLLPRPVTPEVARLVNELFGRKR